MHDFQHTNNDLSVMDADALGKHLAWSHNRTIATLGNSGDLGRLQAIHDEIHREGHDMHLNRLVFEPIRNPLATNEREDTLDPAYDNALASVFGGVRSDGKPPVPQEEFKQLSLWADPAMKSAVPQPAGADGRVRPTVRILQATPDPLGTLAAVMAIYKGGVKRSLAEVSDEERREALAEMLKTKLQGPLETINFTILIEGVTRSFTHQMVRGRAAFYAQESMRFAVPDQESWADRVARPVGYEGWTRNMQLAWDESVEATEERYLHLVNSGVPAEDARGLMPHAMTTRLVWQVSLRELLHVAGLRLCTQAQFEWRTVLSLVVARLRERNNPHKDLFEPDDGWQFEAIADLLRPVCYAEGKCGFMSAFDRSCSIRERVNANEAIGRPSSEWGETFDVFHVDEERRTTIEAIRPEEWLADPGAAR